MGMWDPGLARRSAKGLKSKPPFHVIVERPQSLMLQKICRQSFRFVTFGDEQTVHLTLSLKKGKCMVFKPRQVQDLRIVKFKEI